jgi:hypothetical protein
VPFRGLREAIHEHYRDITERTVYRVVARLVRDRRLVRTPQGYLRAR